MNFLFSLGEIVIHKIDWVIFDLGGVLIDWDPRSVYGRGGFDPIKVDHFLAQIATSEWNSQMDAGLPFQTAIDQRSLEHPEWREWLQAWRNEWPTMLRGVLHESVTIFDEVVSLREAGGLEGVLALSNWAPDTFKVAQARFPSLNKFDARLISGEERLIKPDPAFFRLLSERHYVVPERAIFIDDLSKNTDIAKKLGYNVHVFKDAPTLREDLVRLKILKEL